MEKEALFKEFEKLFNKLGEPDEDLQQKVVHLKITTLQVQLDDIKQQKQEKYEDLRSYAEIIKGSIDALTEIETCLTKELERYKATENNFKKSAI